MQDLLDASLIAEHTPASAWYRPCIRAFELHLVRSEIDDRVPCMSSILHSREYMVHREDTDIDQSLCCGPNLFAHGSSCIPYMNLSLEELPWDQDHVWEYQAELWRTGSCQLDKQHCLIQNPLVRVPKLIDQPREYYNKARDHGEWATNCCH